MSGSKGMQTKVKEGYLKQSGEPSRTLVDEGFEVAQTKPGTIGVRVRIMTLFQDVTGEVRRTVKPVKKEAAAELITEALAKGEGDEDDVEAKKPKKGAAPKRPKKAKAEAKAADAKKDAPTAEIGAAAENTETRQENGAE
jgi:ribosomal protein S3